MNYRRQEMEKSLPEASQFLCKYLWQHLNEAGVRIPDEDILLIGRLVSAYVRDTDYGKKTFLKLLNAEVAQPSALKTYFKSGRPHDEQHRIKYSDLVEFKGWIYKGAVAIAHSKVDVDDREDAVVCDSCAGRFPADYCTKQVEVLKASGQTREEVLCNYCRYHSENPRVRETGSASVCAACEKITCENHPRHAEPMTDQNTRHVVGLLQPGTGQNRIPEGLPMPPGWER